MKPLSNDLRERFVHAVLIEGMTCRAAGERFAVSHSAVIKIVRQFVETDAIDPQKVGGSRKPLEFVVNSVGKDKIVGYLSAPKSVPTSAGQNTSGGN